jgi:xyloglucan-specific exo-beta-1,4-glucanase
MKKTKLSITLILLFLSGIIIKAHSQSQWGNVAIGGGGFVTGIITSKTEQNLMYARTDVGGAYRWNAASSKWIPLLDWNSMDEKSYQGVEAIALDPQASNKVYMLVGTSYWNGGKTAILRSSDYGNTFSITDVTAKFKAHGNGGGRGNGERLAVDPNNSNILYCGTRANGLWKSTDAGVTWNQVWNGVTTTTNGNGICFVVFDGSSVSGGVTQRIFVGVSRTKSANLYMSTNGGSSFAAVSGATTSLMPQRAVRAGDGNLYITYSDIEGPGNTGSGQVSKYNITGGTWTNVTPSGFTSGTGFSGISVDPNNSQRIIASTCGQWRVQYGSVYGERFFLSTNGGTSWKDLVGSSGIILNNNGMSFINGKAIHWACSMEFDPFNTAKAWVTSGNGVFSCDNLNATQTTWKFDVKGLEETVPIDIVSITGGPLVTAILDYDGFIHTDVTQYVANHSPSIGHTTGIAFAANSTSKLVRVGEGGGVGRMYYSTNQGVNWTSCTLNGKSGKVAVSADGSTFLHCPEGSSTTYRSTNNGGSWTSTGVTNISNAVPVADMVNTNKFYLYNPSSGSMMVSTNAGASFAASGSVGTWGSTIIRTVPGQEGHIWVAMKGGGLKRSINSGSSFTTISGVTNCAAVGLGKAASGSTYHTIYIWGTVGGVTGIFLSTNEGASWTRVNDDAHEYGGLGDNGNFVIGDMNVYGRYYMATVGRGIVYGESTSAANQTPTVSITSPANNVSFTAPASVTINANAADADGTVSKVDFYNGTTLLGSDATSPYSFVWSSVATGTYSLTAKATDNAGAITTSAAVSISVTAASNQAPTVSITSPANNTSFTAPASITINANAADADGTVSKVDFYNGTTLLGSDATSPYSFAWSSVAAGTYSLTAKATDNAGAITTSAAVSISVTAASNQAPTVSITSPANNASFTAPASITINANAADADGTVSKVEFYNGTTLLGSDATSPYSFAWSSVAAGTYSLTAKATDNAGAITTSSAVVVTVTSATVSCPVNAVPPAAQWELHNDWADQGNGSSVSNTTDALKVTHRQWGKNLLWLIESGKTMTITSGQQYTIKFDFMNDPSNPVSSIDVGYATSFDWANATIAGTLVNTTGFSSSVYTTKTVTITATTNATVYLVFKLNWPGQPNQQTNIYFKNISSCGTSSARMASVNSSITNFEVTPNPFENQTMIKMNEEDLTTPIKLTVADLSGKVVYQSDEYSTNEEIYLGNNLKGGMYIVQASYSGKVVTFKLVKNQ